MMKTTLKINGMSCTSCSAAIERELSKWDSIQEATINFATEKLHVTYDESKVSIEEIGQAIEDLGYHPKKGEQEDVSESSSPVKPIRKTVKVSGMTCTACSKAIEKSLGKMDGIQEATINFAAEKLTVTFWPNQVRMVEIEKKVSDLGYELMEEKSKGENKDEDEMMMRKSWNQMMRSAMLSGTIMLLMMIHMVVGIDIPYYLVIVNLLAFPNIFWLGRSVHKASYHALKNRRPNMDVLVSLGSLPPYLIGLMAFVFPLQAFTEMASSIMTFHLIGKYLESRAKGRASQAIRKLVEMGAKTARILLKGEEVEISVEELQLGDIMIVKPGEKIPTDGEVIEGRSTVDESMATGESMPVKRKAGDQVIGATINKQGLLKIKVTKLGDETFLSQVIQLVEACQGSKVPIQEFADRITGYFVPAILVITALVFTSNLVFVDVHQSILQWGAGFLPWVNPEAGPLSIAFVTATAVLVIACPCALGLGTPTALMVGSGMGAENGILIRNGEAVQTFKNLKMVIFDKTGTLTHGKPAVTDLFTESGYELEELMEVAGSLEKGSEHPLAYAILEAVRKKGIHTKAIENFEAITGMGIEGRLDGQKVFMGNRKLMETYGVAYGHMDERIIQLEKEAKTVMMVAQEDQLLGVIAVADPVKEDSAKAVKELQEMGIQTAMVTGDNQRTANAIAKKIGIDYVIADVLPEGKVEEVKKLQEKFETVAMVGDGINDAPALKQANIGIAIGTGTDVAIEAADVTLVKGDLSGIISAILLSRGTFRKIKENYFWAWFYNAVAIPVAMLGLLHPMIGAAAMSVSSLNVVYNSLRLKKINIKPVFKQ